MAWGRNSSGEQQQKAASSGRHERPGRHREQPLLCTYTWGTCDVRSSQPPENTTLPHICGEGLAGHEGPHICTAPGCNAHQVGKNRR
jgi:hypothetical protein